MPLEDSVPHRKHTGQGPEGSYSESVRVRSLALERAGEVVQVQPVATAQLVVAGTADQAVVMTDAAKDRGGRRGADE